MKIDATNTHWYVERIDNEDGTIRYEVWNSREGFLFGIYEDLTPRAKQIADEICDHFNDAEDGIRMGIAHG